MRGEQLIVLLLIVGGGRVPDEYSYKQLQMCSYFYWGIYEIKQLLSSGIFKARESECFESTMWELTQLAWKGLGGRFKLRSCL